jgi:hypothetical protein
MAMISSSVSWLTLSATFAGAWWCSFCRAPGGLGFGDPAGYDGGVGARVQGGAVAGQPSVALGDGRPAGTTADGVGAAIAAY